jgi:cell division protein FtsW
MDDAKPTIPVIGIDRPLFISVLMLVGFGVVMVYSASAIRASAEQGSEAYFLHRQAIYATIGIIAMVITSQINYHFYQRIIYPILLAAIVGLILVHTPIGRTLNGASRWIGIGSFRFQPAEAMKIALILWFSYSLAKKQEKIKTFSIGFLPHLIVPGVIILLCLSQPDFGTAVMVAVVTFSLLFVAGAKLSYMMLAVIVATPIAYYLVAGSEYRLRRILAYLDPISARFADGYQLTQSLFGFSEGGMFGVGIGDGLQKFFFLPEPENDFIAAIIAEELGVVGIWVMMLLFAVLVSRGVLIAIRARDEFGMYIAVGFTVLFGVQALINLGVAMGLLPTKGLTLPFVSYGGSSLIVSLFAIGILLNVSKRPEGALRPAKQKPPSSKGAKKVNRRVSAKGVA